MIMKEMIKKIWYCDDKEALRNGLLLCMEYLDKERYTQERQELIEDVMDEIS